MGTPRPSTTPAPTDGPVLVETRLSVYLYHSVISQSISGQIHVRTVKTLFIYSSFMLLGLSDKSTITVLPLGQLLTDSDTSCRLQSASDSGSGSGPGADNVR